MIIRMKKHQKLLVLLMASLLCFNNFAAIVSDNDGSAFITKAEFDSLKNSFQAQINEYNTAIDSKIDGAIAAYLAGIVTTVGVEQNVIYNEAYKFGRDHLYWYKSKDYFLNPMPVHFQHVASSIVGYNQNSSSNPNWASSTTVADKDEYFPHDWRINVKDSSAKSFDVVKKFVEQLDFFSIHDSGVDTNTPIYSRRYMDGFMYKKLEDRKFGDPYIAIFAQNSEKAGTINNNLREEDIKKADADDKKIGIAWIYGKPEWGMPAARTKTGELGTVNKKHCPKITSWPSTTAYTSMSTLYSTIYSKFLEFYCVWPEAGASPLKPIGQTQNTLTSSYDESALRWDGTSTDNLRAPMDYNPSLSSDIVSKYVYAHSYGALTPSFDCAPVYIGNFLEWNNTSDNKLVGENLDYQMGRCVLKASDTGTLKLKIRMHGTGRINLYVNTSGSKTWTDIRGNQFGSKSATLWTTETQYLNTLNSWPANTSFTNDELKSYKLNIQKGDKLYVNICPTNNDPAYVEFESAIIEIDS